MRTFFGAALLIVAAAVHAQSPTSEAQSAARAALFGSPAFTQIGILETTAREYAAAGNHAAALPLREKSLALLEEALGKDDIVINWDTGRFVVDETSILYVSGMKIDWREEVFGSQFEISNPNATGGCGCGESFSV